jgi:oligopeptide transport system ATP-binding protein
MQMVFQDPQASLNPAHDRGRDHRRAAGRARQARGKKLERVYELMDAVGLNRNFANRYPHAFSGGQRQRIGIARALALNPKFIVCDEPIAALDVSIQAQVVNLLEELQERFGLTYMFISHDLSMVQAHRRPGGGDVSGQDRGTGAARRALRKAPAPLYRGAAVGRARAQPVARGKRAAHHPGGRRPSPSNPPKGCNFCTRCPKVMDVCHRIDPEFREVERGHFVACHLHDATMPKQERARAQPAPQRGLSISNKERMHETQTTLMGAVAALALVPALAVAEAERGSSGHLNIIYWQAVSTMNPFLSGGTKEMNASSIVIEPLARFDNEGELVAWLADEIPTLDNGGVSRGPEIDHLAAEGRTSVVRRLRGHGGGCGLHL